MILTVAFGPEDGPGAILVAGLIVALRDPGLVKTLIPVIGAGTWTPILWRPGRSKSCRGI